MSVEERESWTQVFLQQKRPVEGAESMREFISFANHVSENFRFFPFKII